MSDTANRARTVDGVALPPAGTWSIDAGHSSVDFKVKHLGLAKSRGRFATGAGKGDGGRAEMRGGVVLDVEVVSRAEVVVAAGGSRLQRRQNDGHLELELDGVGRDVHGAVDAGDSASDL